MSDLYNDIALQDHVYDLVKPGHLLFSNTTWAIIGGHTYPHLSWAFRSRNLELLHARFKEDMSAWIAKAGPECSIIVRKWPETERIDENTWQVFARFAVVDRFGLSIEPDCTIKPEGEEVPTLDEEKP